MRHTIMMCLIVSFAAFIGANIAAADVNTTKETKFLIKAAQDQQREIALGKLAANRAENPAVRQLAERIIQDRSTANTEVKALAARENIDVSKDAAAELRGKEKALSQLSGKEFDRAYIQQMLRDYQKEVAEFENGAKQLSDPEVQQWAANALPVLKGHLQTAQNIATDLGIESSGRREKQGNQDGKKGNRDEKRENRQERSDSQQPS